MSDFGGETFTKGPWEYAGAKLGGVGRQGWQESSMPVLAKEGRRSSANVLLREPTRNR